MDKLFLLNDIFTDVKDGLITYEKGRELVKQTFIESGWLPPEKVEKVREEIKKFCVDCSGLPRESVDEGECDLQCQLTEALALLEGRNDLSFMPWYR